MGAFNGRWGSVKLQLGHTGTVGLFERWMEVLLTPPTSVCQSRF